MFSSDISLISYNIVTCHLYWLSGVIYNSTLSSCFGNIALDIFEVVEDACGLISDTSEVCNMDT